MDPEDDSEGMQSCHMLTAAAQVAVMRVSVPIEVQSPW